VDCSGGAGWRWFGRCRIAQSPRDDLGDRRALQESCRSDVASPREAASEPRHCGPASWVVSTRSRRTMRVPHSAVRLGVPIVVAMTFAMFPPSASSSTRAAMAASCQSYGLRVSNGPGRACWVAVRVGACRNARPRQRVVRRALPSHHGGAVPLRFEHRSHRARRQCVVFSGLRPERLPRVRVCIQMKQGFIFHWWKNLRCEERRASGADTASSSWSSRLGAAEASINIEGR
jgi:hypothetical protein